VGGGNAGVECAQYLAKWELKNRVTLLVRGSGFDRCNEENQAIIHDLERRGLVKIWFNSKVKEIQRTKLVVDREGELLSIPNDYLFVMAGAEMPHKMLMGFGIQMDKKFGEGLVRKR
jgi:thioredoxin reductase